MHVQLSVTDAQVLLRSATARLGAVSDAPRLEAEHLLAAALRRPRLYLIAGIAADADAGQLAEFERNLRRREAGEPFAYILGNQPFRQIELEVNRDVLIPRADTEHLVDWALALIEAPAWPDSPRVWDVATGSGCVALAIACEQPAMAVLASDVSAAALVVARRNALRLGCARVEFAEADGLQLDDVQRRFELIVANPPYIAEGDPHLPALAHEPRLALVSGPDGLACLRELIAQAPARLVPDGWLLLEHGHDQAEAVRALLAQAGFADIASRRDYGGHERVSGGRRP